MYQNKNKIIILGAFAITALLIVPRLLIVLKTEALANTYGLTIVDVLIRAIILFCYTWCILSYNLKWHTRWSSIDSSKKLLLDVCINIAFLLMATISLTVLKQSFALGILGRKAFFLISLMVYIIVLVIVLLLSRLVNLNLKYQQNLLEKEQTAQLALRHQLEALQNQINPHFLFNALNSLNALIRQKSDKASLFVDKLSWLLRYTLQQSQEELLSLEEELAYLNAYIFLQKERFGEKLIININIPSELRKRLIPSFSLQLLVENAIKHNIVSNKNPLKIDIYTMDNYIQVKNPLQKRRDQVKSTQKGLANLSTRFKLLKKEDIQIVKTTTYFLVKLPI